MKLESLVTVNQLRHGEYVPGSCTHRPSTHERQGRLKHLYPSSFRSNIEGMYYVYLLYSPSKDHFYVGFSENVEERLRSHNQKRNESTKSGSPWRLVYFEAYEHQEDALRRERKLKHHARGIIELKKRITIPERNGEGGVPR